MAGWRLGKAFIEFSARDGGLSRAMSSLKRVGSGMLSVFRKIAFAAVAVGAAVLGASVVMIKAVAAQETAEAKLGAVISSTGGAANISKKNMIAYAASLQKVTTFADDAIIAGEALLATFVDIKGQVFKETIAVALDMATVVGQDLRQSLIQLGKAFNDPITGMTALRRTGVSFTNSERDMIATLQKTNRLVEAQGELMKVLEMQFGGAAAEAADTLGGKIAQLKNEFGDLLEKLAGSVGFRDFVEQLRTVIEMLGEGPSALADFAQGLADVGWAAMRVVDWFGEIRATWDALKGLIGEKTAARMTKRMNDTQAAYRAAVTKGEATSRRLLILARQAARAQEAAVGKQGEWIRGEVAGLERKVKLQDAMRKATLKKEEEVRKEAENAAKFQTDVLDKIADSKRTSEQRAIAAAKKTADEMRKIAKATGQDVVAINEWEAAEVQKIRDKVEASFAAKIDTNKEKATELGDALKEAMSVTPEWVGLQDLYKRMATASKSDKQGRIANILEQQKKIEEEGVVLARKQTDTLEAIRAELAAGSGPGGTGIAAGP